MRVVRASEDRLSSTAFERGEIALYKPPTTDWEVPVEVRATDLHEGLALIQQHGRSLRVDLHRLRKQSR
jgi:hypothetical protein